MEQETANPPCVTSDLKSALRERSESTDALSRIDSTLKGLADFSSSGGDDALVVHDPESLTLYFQARRCGQDDATARCTVGISLGYEAHKVLQQLVTDVKRSIDAGVGKSRY